MAKCKVLLIGTIVVSVLIQALLADRTSRKIYESIQADHFCFRRLNATHQIGCASGRSGNVGVVHLVESDGDITYIVKIGPHPPYIAVLPMPFFNILQNSDKKLTTYRIALYIKSTSLLYILHPFIRTNMKILESSGRVSGVMVLKQEERPPVFSPDQSCPNQNFGLYSKSEIYANCQQVKWNPPNPLLGMMYEDWNIPIFLITNETSTDQIIHKCYNKFNRPINGVPRSWPLCSSRLKSSMLAAKDTSTCMRRSKWITNLNPMRFCDPLGGKNIITTLFTKNETEEIPSRSVIVVSARLDAFSMYDDLSPGAHSTITGLVTLLAIAHTMATLRDKIEASRKDIDKRILFTIFNGENFDYIGSSRMVYDMKNGAFPPKANAEIPSYSLHHISHFIELSQLAPFENKIWFHVDPLSTSFLAVNETVNMLIKDIQQEVSSISKLKIEEAPRDIPLPPSSFQNFLKYDKNISGIVIADHSEAFTNKYYNSFYDNAESLGVINGSKNLSEPLADIVAAVSKTLFKLLTGENYTDDVRNEPLIEQLLHCYLVNVSCDLFHEVNDPVKLYKLHDRLFQLYIGVEVSQQRNPVTAYTHLLLAYLSGQQIESRNEKNCSGNDRSMYNYYWMAGSNLTGICVQSAAQRTQAVSPAFLSEDWTSTEYSTWSESVWEEVSVVIFLQPSIVKEATTLLAGCIISVISLIVVYFANKRASVLFGARNLTGC